MNNIAASIQDNVSINVDASLEVGESIVFPRARAAWLSNVVLKAWTQEANVTPRMTCSRRDRGHILRNEIQTFATAWDRIRPPLPF